MAAYSRNGDGDGEHYQPVPPPPHSQQPFHDHSSDNAQFSDYTSPPPPPAHRTFVGMHPNSQYSQYSQTPGQRPYGSNNYSDYSPPGITPGADNLGESAAGGGINGIAIGVASSHERESGAQALRDLHGWQGPSPSQSQYQSAPPRPVQPQPSYGSNAPLAASAVPPAGVVSPALTGSDRSLPLDNRPSPPQSSYPYDDTPYNRYSSSNLQLAPQMGAINPHEADDDDDWGMGPRPTTQQKRRSFVPFGSRGSPENTPNASAAALGAGAGAYAATRDPSGHYNAVPGGSAGPTGHGSAPELNEKSAWLSSQTKSRKKLTFLVVAAIAIVVIGAIVGGVLGATLNRGGGGSAQGGQTQQSVDDDNKSHLTSKSAEIQKLMNNPNLHKVFPGMDYTPLNAQYPDCMHVPPSQNNITRDMAVMSQLTNAVRLYGTDCNQTEMVLEAITRLELKDMKVWLGVWLGNNDTTNDRQMSQMWSIIDHHGADRFKGIIVGNEVLFREDLTETELLDYIEKIHSNLTAHNIDLPIATSDLGDNWTAEMATKVNIVMSNVHPFFAGVEASKAAGWTWDFWTNHDVVLTKSNSSIQQIVAEVGWPSGGGNNCGDATCTSKTQGSIASIDEMNTFMEKWICPSLTNGTEFFWFSAFDEPWKIRYNEKGKEWEDKWGLMDVDRNLKPGLNIPDCGGKGI